AALGARAAGRARAVHDRARALRALARRGPEDQLARALGRVAGVRRALLRDVRRALAGADHALPRPPAVHRRERQIRDRRPADRARTRLDLSLMIAMLAVASRPALRRGQAF